MAWQKPKFKKGEVSQRINLKKLLGKDATDAEINAFITEAVNRIRERTQSGKPLGGHGSKFRRYSEEYAEQKGVSRGDVDLTLTESMLNSMKGERQRKNLVKLQIGEGGRDTDTLKAYNHNVGDTLPKRTFFGLTKKEASEIAKKVKQGGTVTRDSKKTVREAIESLRLEVE